MIYSFLFVVAFFGGSFFSLDETNASSLVPTIHSVSTSGNWNDPNSWIEGRVPTPTDVVAIRGTITLNAVPTISGLLVDWGGNIAGATTITVNGDIENHGVISGNSYITLNSGNLTNRGVWLVQMTTINGIASIVDSDTPIMGSILLNSDISII